MRAPWVYFGRGQSADYQPLVNSWQFPTFTAPAPPYTYPAQTATTVVWLDMAQSSNPFPDIPAALLFQGFVGGIHIQGTSILPGSGTVWTRMYFDGLFGGLFGRVN